MFEEIRNQFFPMLLSENIQAMPVHGSAFWGIISPIFDTVFPDTGIRGSHILPKERQQNSQRLRAAFHQVHHEYFVFYNEQEEPIGWSYGEMRDSMTFFMSNSGILSSYRRQGLYSAFLEQFLAYLTALGYERIISNHQTNNRAVIIAKLKAGFNITAINLDERWGAQVELTYFMHHDRQQEYEKVFSLDQH